MLHLTYRITHTTAFRYTSRFYVLVLWVFVVLLRCLLLFVHLLLFLFGVCMCARACMHARMDVDVCVCVCVRACKCVCVFVDSKTNYCSNTCSCDIQGFSSDSLVPIAKLALCEYCVKATENKSESVVSTHEPSICRS